ncbi:MAG: hypothetical protein U1E87_10000 [Alphaproteobacteria bacterium]
MLHRSLDFGRNLSLGVLAIGGLAILVLALMVDYKILHDFWTTIYEQFLQVRESLKDNVVFKSLRVLFAVLAIHFLISAPGVLGKAVRAGPSWSASASWCSRCSSASTSSPRSRRSPRTPRSPASRSMPRHRHDGHERSDPPNLGLRPSSGANRAAAQAARAESSDTAPKFAKISDVIGPTKKTDAPIVQAIKKMDFDSAGTVVDMLIFLFVSSVGALCMHYSLKAFDALFGGVGAQHPEHKMPGFVHGVTYWALGKGEWRAKTSKDLADERQRILHAQHLIGNANYRQHLMSKFFAEFAGGYMEGLHARDASPRRLMGRGYEELAEEMRGEIAAARDAWSAEAIAETLPDDDVRYMLGYDPNRRVHSNTLFGFVGNGRRGKAQYNGGRLSDRYEEDPAWLPRPARD